MTIFKNKTEFSPIGNRRLSFGAFTVIELLVVIAIIGLISSVVLVSMRGVREKARIAKCQQDIDAIVTAMYLFKDKYEELPPLGDNCSACSNPCSSSWTQVMDALVNEGLMGRVDKDPWGNYYCYDDNDDLCCGGCSPVYSMGPNGVNDSWFNCPRADGCPQSICNDDVGTILFEGDRLYPW